jgi:2-amino-4-hydroxy-6-hydroxymethyldihydropteridine diphosphokinase
MSETAVLSLGSNLGEREIHLRRAVRGISEVIRLTSVSSLFETRPVNCPEGTPLFLNCLAIGLTGLSPEALLSSCLEIEHRLGRRRGIGNTSRIIDIDLIFVGAARRRSKEIILPHPRYRDRDFVLAPLRELGMERLMRVDGSPFSGEIDPDAVVAAGPLFAPVVSGRSRRSRRKADFPES